MVISAKNTLAVLAVALMAPASASAAEIREQPADTARTQVVRVQWTGGAADEVVVERRYGLDWVTAASDLPAQHGADGIWLARWQPGRDAPAGTHRIRIEAAGETLLSDEFHIRPCDCVLADPLRSKWRDGRFRLRLTAEYPSAGHGDFRLPSAEVQTGRPVVRVLRDGHRIGSVRLRYRDGAFRGTWGGPKKPPGLIVFRLVSLTDGAGNGYL